MKPSVRILALASVVVLACVVPAAPPAGANGRTSHAESCGRRVGQPTRAGLGTRWRIAGGRIRAWRFGTLLPGSVHRRGHVFRPDRRGDGDPPARPPAPDPDRAAVHRRAGHRRLRLRSVRRVGRWHGSCTSPSVVPDHSWTARCSDHGPRNCWEPCNVSTGMDRTQWPISQHSNEPTTRTPNSMSPIRPRCCPPVGVRSPIDAAGNTLFAVRPHHTPQTACHLHQSHRRRHRIPSRFPPLWPTARTARCTSPI